MSSNMIRRSVGALKGVPVKPISSTNPVEAKRRVLTLYKQWYRSAPEIIFQFRLPYTKEVVRSKIRDQFLKNAHVRDVRAIDLLVIKGQMELQETVMMWKQECHIHDYFKNEVAVPEHTDFLGKFFTQKH